MTNLKPILNSNWISIEE